MRQIKLFYQSIIREKFTQREFNTIDVAVAVNGGKDIQSHLNTLHQIQDKK